MAGYDWSWTFFLNKTIDGRFTLSAKQTVREESAMRISERQGLRDGVDVYEALCEMVGEAGYHVPDYDLESIAAEVAEVDQSLADAFLNGEELSEDRQERHRQQEAAHRENILRPYRKLIDEYVLRFDASGRRYRPSQRVAATRFIEDYIVANGKLPEGIHLIRLGQPMNYSDGEHDFTPLGFLAKDLQR